MTADKTVVFKQIDVDSLEIDGIDFNDAPDFSDAYFSAGQYTDGSDIELVVLAELSTGDMKYAAIDKLFF
jgi:hypothetical protein